MHSRKPITIFSYVVSQLPAQGRCSRKVHIRMWFLNAPGAQCQHACGNLFGVNRLRAVSPCGRSVAALTYSEGAEVPFDNILDRITGSDPSVTDYILWSRRRSV